MKFQVNTTTLAKTVNTLQEKLEGIDGKRKSMYVALHELDTMWQGASHDAFQAQYEQDNELMVQLLDELQSFIDHVSTSRKNYDSCEEKAKSLANSISI